MLEEAVRYVTASSLFMSAGFVLSAIDVSAFGLLVKIVHKIGAFFTYWSKIVHKWGKFAPFIISI